MGLPPVDVIVRVNGAGDRSLVSDSERVPRGAWRLKSVAIDSLIPPRIGQAWAKVEVLLALGEPVRAWEGSSSIYPGKSAGWTMDIPLKEADVCQLEVWATNTSEYVAVFRLERDRE